MNYRRESLCAQYLALVTSFVAFHSFRLLSFKGKMADDIIGKIQKQTHVRLSPKVVAMRIRFPPKHTKMKTEATYVALFDFLTYELGAITVMTSVQKDIQDTFEG